jgi:hypothetical protein
LSASTFNVFRSDIDYTLIISEDMGHEAARLYSVYEVWRRNLPMLGELEIYTQAEVDQRERLMLTHGPLLTYIQMLRKWSRLHKERHSSPYHCEKSELARARILAHIAPSAGSSASARLGAGLRDFLAREFGIRTPIEMPARFESASLFLGWSLATEDHSPHPSRLTLPAPQLAVLLALLPDYNHRGEILDLRREPKIAAAYAAVVMDELLICRSVARDPRRKEPDLAHWLSHLERELLPRLSPGHSIQP